MMLASFTAGVEYQRGDVNQDGSVSIDDVTCLIDYLLTGSWGDEPVIPPDGHEYVDLGLLSGTLWATCNVGAENPEESGDFFAWGETVAKETYTWNTYTLCDGAFNTMLKYCLHSNLGLVVDNKTELDPEDDAAYVNWGPSWRIPTLEQLLELRNSCTWTWTTLNEVKGHLVTGPNGNTLFMPAAGHYFGSTCHDIGQSCSYWSRNLSEDFSYNAWDMGFNSDFVEVYTNSRYEGYAVRAVYVP
jgi:hypothetical protein